MNKKIITILVTIIPALFVASPAFAALVVTPTSTAAPATINFTTGNGASGAVLYRQGTTLPILCHEGSGVGGSGTVNSITEDQGCTPGAFTNSTPGTYMLVQAQSVQCFNQSYSSCSGSNPGIPGSNEADFIITGGGGASTTTSTAPMNNVSSTKTLSGFVFNEIVTLPIYELQQYETPLVGIAIMLAIFGAVFGFLKWFNII